LDVCISNWDHFTDLYDLSLLLSKALDRKSLFFELRVVSI